MKGEKWMDVRISLWRAMRRDRSPCMATCSGGKPSLVQEQIFARRILSLDKIYFKRNGRSLEPRSDPGRREMVIQFDFGRMDKTRLIALPTHTKTTLIGLFLYVVGGEGGFETRPYNCSYRPMPTRSLTNFIFWLAISCARFRPVFRIRVSSAGSLR